MLAYLSLILSLGLREVPVRPAALATLGLFAVSTGAQFAQAGPVDLPVVDPLTERVDPLLVAVGPTPIRLSDARVHAETYRDTPLAQSVRAAEIFSQGVVDEMTDHEALALAAESQGIDKSADVQARLAMARRQILASAYLDLALAEAVTEETIKASYDQAAATARDDAMVNVRRILVSSETEAWELRAMMTAGIPFSDLAERRSLDFATRRAGGLTGKVRLSELPSDIRAALSDLPIGQPSSPVAAENGYYLLQIESRTALRLPDFEELRPMIEARLREEVIAGVIEEARAAVDIRLGDDVAAPVRPVLASAEGMVW